MGRKEIGLHQLSTLLTLVGEDYTLIRRGNYYTTVEHDSLVVDPIKDIFFWNSLNLAGDAYSYLRRVRELPHEECLTILRHVRPEEIKISERIISKPNELLVEVFYEYGKDHRDYWYNYRGYTQETVDKYKLGYNGQFWLLPLYYNGEFKNFQCRGFDDKGKKIIRAYYNGIGVVPFNLDNLPEDKDTTVYITESMVNAIMLIQNGKFAVSTSSGTMGWNHEWSHLLRDYKSVKICYDNDRAGIEGSLRVATSIRHNSSILIWPKTFPNKYDITDLYKDGGKVEELESEFILPHIASKLYK